jgi:hypothetical protein
MDRLTIADPARPFDCSVVVWSSKRVLLSAKYTRHIGAAQDFVAGWSGAGQQERELINLRGERVHGVNDENGDWRVEEEVEPETLAEQIWQVFEDDEVMHHRSGV